MQTIDNKKENFIVNPCGMRVIQLFTVYSLIKAKVNTIR